SERASTLPASLNPVRLFPLAVNSSGAFLVDGGDLVWHLASLAFAINGIASGEGPTTTVPVGGFGETSDGASVLKWDSDKAGALFDALANDTPVPPETTTTASTGG